MHILSLQTNTVIVVLFLTPDLTVVISDVIPLDPAHSRLIGVTIPYLCCTKKVINAIIRGIMCIFFSHRECNVSFC